MVDAEAAVLGVSDVSPVRNAKDVAGDTTVTATFISEMNPTTLTISTFTLTQQGSTTSVEATVSYGAETKTVMLDQKANLETNNTTYIATITGGPNGVTDASGGAASKPASSSTLVLG